MKKILCIMLTFVLCAVSLPCLAMDISAHSAILIDAQYGNIIFEKNASQRLTMASTTKIMTAICAIEEGNMDAEVKIAPEAVGVEGSSIYLTGSENLTLRELVYGLMLNSGNDAAVAIACAVSGSVEKFASLMNTKAKEIGVKNSSFRNPNGLDEEGHYTTAHDLALIAAYAMKNEEFKKIASTYQTTIGEGEGIRYLTNHNKLLKRMDGCIGVKTGFTKKSGRCLVSACERGGVTLVAVTLNAPDDWNDHMNMMDYGFGLVESKEVTEAGEPLGTVSIKNGTAPSTGIICQSSFAVPAVDGVRYVSVFRAPKAVEAPVSAGDTLGKVEVYMDGKLIASLSAVASESVPLDKSRSMGATMKKLLTAFVRK